MTQEDKAKAYDIALDKIKRLLGTGSNCSREDLEYVFPELKESKNDRIRKRLTEYFGGYYDGFATDRNPVNVYWEGLEVKEVLAWLEKQSTPQVRTGLEWVNTIDDACDKRYSEEYAHGEYCHEQSFKWGFQEGVDWLEKQGETSPILSNSSNIGKVEQKPTDKIEPKFKVGNKIKLAKEPEYHAREIIAIQNDAYYFDEAIYLPFSRQDEWELVEQEPAEWSEEDEEMFDAIIADIQFTQKAHNHEVNQVVYEREIDWLKSLRPQNRWKPSDEQMYNK